MKSCPTCFDIEYKICFKKFLSIYDRKKKKKLFCSNLFLIFRPKIVLCRAKLKGKMNRFMSRKKRSLKW